MSYESFENLCKEKGLTVYRVAKMTGISTAAFSAWKGGRYTPKIERRRKIADALGVSVEVLDGDAEIVHKSVEGKEYYFSDKTAQAAQSLFESRGLRVLFDAAQDESEENLLKFAAMIRAYKDAENKD